MKNYKVGDYVNVSTEEDNFKGIILQRPELLDDNFIVLKLDNGYNIGIEKNKIKKIELLKEYEEKRHVEKELKRNPKLPTVSILSTGGTISSKVDYRTGGVYADYTARDFVDMCPELLDIANINVKKVMSVMSEDIGKDEWKEIAEKISDELNKKDVNGVVLTTGTDTLHYIAAALSFMIRDINKPVVITGAQRSIDRGSSDAFINLICSVITAARFDFSGVVTCLHGTINDDYCILNRGTKVRKMHTSRRDAFRSINDTPIAKVFPDGKIEILNKNFEKRNNKKTYTETGFDDKIALIHIYPGIDPKLVEYAVNNYNGIVLAATALGHVPTFNKKYSLIDVLEKAKSKGIPVVIASQTLYGRTHPFVYTNLRKLSIEKDCIFAEDMLPEVAFVKLGWLLAKTKDKEKIKKMMLENYCHEINPRINKEEFLN